MRALGPAILFCPADRPERYAKAASRADAVILDLEDAVARGDKATARQALVQTPLDPASTVVRVNPAGTAEHESDLAAVAKTQYRMIMLAKTERAADLDALDRFEVLALVETALGVENVGEIARHPAVAGVMWGAEDLIASLGGRSSRDRSGRYRDVARFARARTLLASRAAGKLVVDAVHIDIADLEGLRAEAADAVDSGFGATACIHPTQVEVIRSAYAADSQSREWARRVLDEAVRQPGVFQFEGRMVDEPILRQARELLSGGEGAG